MDAQNKAWRRTEPDSSDRSAHRGLLRHRSMRRPADSKFADSMERYAWKKAHGISLGHFIVAYLGSSSQCRRVQTHGIFLRPLRITAMYLCMAWVIRPLVSGVAFSCMYLQYLYSFIPNKWYYLGIIWVSSTYLGLWNILYLKCVASIVSLGYFSDVFAVFPISSSEAAYLARLFCGRIKPTPLHTKCPHDLTKSQSTRPEWSADSQKELYTTNAD